MASLKSMLQDVQQSLLKLPALEEKLQAIKVRVDARNAVDIVVTNESDNALARVESVMETTHRQFSSLDTDGNGMLDVHELGTALGELGAITKDASLAEVSAVMSKYDADGNGKLDRAEFAALVRDLALNGKLRLREDLERECHRIASGRSLDPWSNVLRGDAKLRRELGSLREKALGQQSGRASRLSGSGDGDGETTKDAHRLSQTKSPTGTFIGLLGLLCTCCRYIPILHPNSKFITWWMGGMALLIIYCGVVIPLEIAFESQLERDWGATGWQVWSAWNVFVDFLFIVDIVLNFRTGYEAHGTYVDDDRKVALHYLHGSFAIDFVGSFPLNLIMMWTSSDDEGGSSATGRLNRQLRLLRIAKLNRLLRLFKLSRSLKHLALLITLNPSILRILTLTLIMGGCCHWLGCMWWFISDLEISDGCAHQLGVNASEHAACLKVPRNDWQPTEDLLRSEFSLQFAAAFFWGAGMITTVVPYDVMPATTIEYYATAGTLFIGLALNAFVIGSMASALSSMDSTKSIAAGKLEAMSCYMQLNHVPAELKGNILGFYEYLFTSSQSMEDAMGGVSLPPSLGTRLSIHMHRRMIMRSPFLSSLPNDMLMSVLMKVRSCIFVPMQVVYAEGVLHTTRFFLRKGAIRLLKSEGESRGEAHERDVGAIGPGEAFGLNLEQLQLTQPSDGWQSTSISNAAAHQISLEMARAESYCDSTTIALADLQAIFSHGWGRLGGPAMNRDEKSPYSGFRRRSFMASSDTAKSISSCMLACKATSKLRRLPGVRAVRAAQSAHKHRTKKVIANVPRGTSPSWFSRSPLRAMPHEQQTAPSSTAGDDENSLRSVESAGDPTS